MAMIDAVFFVLGIAVLNLLGAIVWLALGIGEDE
jgi:hypothetical protein